MSPIFIVGRPTGDLGVPGAGGWRGEGPVEVLTDWALAPGDGGGATGGVRSSWETVLETISGVDKGTSRVARGLSTAPRLRDISFLPL